MGRMWRIAVFFVIVLLLGGVIYQTADDLAADTNLGLDLQGGFEILYQVELRRIQRLRKTH
nr:hypothetical protein [Thalassobacillus sp. C254]